MKKIQYNINDTAEVVLTKKGAQILNESDERPIFMHTHNGPYSEGEVFSSELWNIMHIFGSHLYNGCEIPFVSNNIIIQEN